MSHELLHKDEYIEQAYLFRCLRERLPMNLSIQDILEGVREEILATTQLPKAITFILNDILMHGEIGKAMSRIPHYFNPFQSYVMNATEAKNLQLDFRLGVEILEKDAAYRARDVSPQGLFMYQFEVIARNRLGYDHSLEAIANDPMFTQDWHDWIQQVRSQVGFTDFSELIYQRSEHFAKYLESQGKTISVPVLFGEREGLIANANRKRDPLFLFAALQRHLNYPEVPRQQTQTAQEVSLPKLINTIEQIKQRIRLLEEEARGGIDLNTHYQKPLDQIPDPPKINRPEWDDFE